MKKDTLNYLWKHSWWGLWPKKEIVDFFSSYGGEKKSEEEIIEQYEKFLAQKKKLLNTFSGERDSFNLLNSAFANLNKEGIISIHYAGTTNSDGKTMAWEKAALINEICAEEQLDFNTDSIKGFCFYHEQDMEYFVPKLNTKKIPIDTLFLTFGSFNADEHSMKEIAVLITDALNNVGLQFKWEDDTDTRIALPNFSWIKEEDEVDWNSFTITSILGDYKTTQSPTSNIFHSNDVVHILEGTFKGMKGVVAEVFEEENRMTVIVELFGRKTPIDLKFHEAKHEI